MAHQRTGGGRHESECSKNGVQAAMIRHNMQVDRQTNNRLPHNTNLMLQSLKHELQEAVASRVEAAVSEMERSAVCRSCASHSPDPTIKPHHQHTYAHKHFDTDINGQKYGTKVFTPRDSLLTTLLDSKQSMVLYNYAVAVLLLFMGYSLLLAFLEDGIISLRLDLVWWNFAQLPLTMAIWTGMLAHCVLCYAAYNKWASRPGVPGVWERRALVTAAVLNVCLHLYLPISYSWRNQLPCACAWIVNCEQLRLYMCMHSFVRETYPRVIKAKVDSAKTSGCPGFDKFIYFVFAPTLLYRDEYPRLATTNWTAVGHHLMQGLLCIVYSNYIYMYGVQIHLKDFGPNDVSVASAIRAMFICMLPGFALLLLIFYGLVHSWANMWCEMLRFADRHYYNAWWTATRMSSYYRDWNLVVHEWLYQYVMKDIALVAPSRRSKTYGALAVFLLSSLFHEYGFITGFRIFCPAMFLLYATGGPGYYFLSRMVRMDAGWNILMYANLTFGQGMFLALYSREWYARENCQPVYEGVWNALIPLSWSCEQLRTDI